MRLSAVYDVNNLTLSNIMKTLLYALGGVGLIVGGTQWGILGAAVICAVTCWICFDGQSRELEREIERVYGRRTARRPSPARILMSSQRTAGNPQIALIPLEEEIEA